MVGAPSLGNLRQETAWPDGKDLGAGSHTVLGSDPGSATYPGGRLKQDMALLQCGVDVSCPTWGCREVEVKLKKDSVCSSLEPGHCLILL